MTDATFHTAAQSAPAVRSWRQSFALMLSIRAERAALARLSADQLADLGLDRDDQSRESRRAAWDVPAQWLLAGKRGK